MTTISASMVKDLRNRMDLPMMECKSALTECNGDIEAAIEWLKKKYKGKMQEREGRNTDEGRIGVFIDEAGKVGALVEIQCETASVGKNELFVDMVNSVAKKIASGSEAAPDAQSVRKDPEVDNMFTEVFGKLRETMNLKRCRRVTGNYLASYVHHDGKSGVLLSLDTEPKSELNVAGDLCMHALFSRPLAIDRSGVPAEQIDEVRTAAIEFAKNEGKPEGIVEKIADGKVNAFYAERVLMEQLHIKTDDYGKKKIVDCLSEAGVKTVTDLVIIKVGE